MKRRQLCGAAAGAPPAPRGEHPRGREAAAAGRGRRRAVSRAAAGGARGGCPGGPEGPHPPRRSRPAARRALPPHFLPLRCGARPSSAPRPRERPRRSPSRRRSVSSGGRRFSRRPPRARGPSPRAGARTHWHSHPCPPAAAVTPSPSFPDDETSHPGWRRPRLRAAVVQVLPPASEGPEGRAGLGCAGLGSGPLGVAGRAPRCPLPSAGPPATEIPPGG